MARPNKYQRRSRRVQVVEQHGYICWLCELPIKESEFSLDHYIPKSFGGTYQIKNLRPAHRLCNELRANEISPSMSKYIVKVCLGLRW